MEIYRQNNQVIFETDNEQTFQFFMKAGKSISSMRPINEEILQIQKYIQQSPRTFIPVIKYQIFLKRIK